MNRKLFSSKRKANENLISEKTKSAESTLETVKKSKKSGFTLIETIVVVAVLAVLVSFSVASLASVSRRRATRVGRLIDSELSTLASNAYSRDGAWRLEFEYDDKKECYVLTQQYNTTSLTEDEAWVDFSSISLSTSVDISFGGDEFDMDNSGGTYYVSLSREKGCYLTEGYFCDKIFVHSASKVVTVVLSPESGGHRVID